MPVMLTVPVTTACFILGVSLLSGCADPEPKLPLVSETDMRSSLRACDIEAVAYGGPSRKYTFIRTDGSKFLATGTGPSFEGLDWVDAEYRLGQIVATETKDCKTPVLLIIS